MIHTKIDGKAQHVFVLRDGEDRMVFIPVTALDKSDFGRLYELEKRVTKSSDLLDLLRDETLSNGNNGMTHFKRVICLATKGEDSHEILEDGTRAKKPKEEEKWEKQPAPSIQEIIDLRKEIQQLRDAQEDTSQRLNTVETRKKPGPKPKTKAKDSSASDES